ncbi:hypothetical protein PanWU01x14_085620 [Parasponia andersonii]|uniref:RNase H type-1 domain-containing protein n=1 Tax=Parasponia andersonii TaxID=3476 RepID=A0A2P5D930_PARAD|nr:hypothetical protein PanWU01x14_085620 [Parasponia andersonii]
MEIWLMEYKSINKVKNVVRPCKSVNTRYVALAPNHNVDATMNSGSRHIDIGAVIRDSNGLVCGAFSSTLMGCSDTYVAECLAIREGVRFALQNNFFYVMDHCVPFFP